MSDELYTSDDAQGYLRAPAMLVSQKDSVPNEAFEASAAYSRDLPQLTPMELQNTESELEALNARLCEILNSIELELKMQEAASSLSKLHLPSGGPNPDQTGQQGPHTGVFSRIPWSPNSDRKSKRLSKQAQDEAVNASHRLEQLRFAQTELLNRRAHLELKLAQHHASILSCGSMQAQPMDFFPEIKLGPQPDTQQLQEIAARIEEFVPKSTPVLDKSDFILSSFQYLLDQKSDLTMRLEAARVEADDARSKADFLAKKLDSENTPAQEENSEIVALRGEMRGLQASFDHEKSSSFALKARCDTQAKEIATLLASLEDVTLMSVKDEQTISRLKSLVQELETKVSELSQAQQRANEARINSIGGSPVLCKEFRSIVNELTAQHFAAESRLRRSLWSQESDVPERVVPDAKGLGRSESFGSVASDLSVPKQTVSGAPSSRTESPQSTMEAPAAGAAASAASAGGSAAKTQARLSTASKVIPRTKSQSSGGSAQKRGVVSPRIGVESPAQIAAKAASSRSSQISQNGQGSNPNRPTGQRKSITNNPASIQRTNNAAPPRRKAVPPPAQSMLV